MPVCVRDCVRIHLSAQGCKTETRNCFCVLGREAVVNATSTCYKSSCVTGVQPVFDFHVVAGWNLLEGKCG